MGMKAERYRKIEKHYFFQFLCLTSWPWSQKQASAPHRKGRFIDFKTLNIILLRYGTVIFYANEHQS